MLNDPCVHSTSAAVHYNLGSDSGAPAPAAHVSHSLSVQPLAPRHVTLES